MLAENCRAFATMMPMNAGPIQEICAKQLFVASTKKEIEPILKPSILFRIIAV